jgi:LPS O-antigen subunit length determinant protein (WzzB/FepE family)
VWGGMSQVESDEIDLGELFAGLWARKFLIVLISALATKSR